MWKREKIDVFLFFVFQVVCRKMNSYYEGVWNGISIHIYFFSLVTRDMP
jgi:hypothetical protein